MSNIVESIINVIKDISNLTPNAKNFDIEKSKIIQHLKDCIVLFKEQSKDLK